MDFRLIALDMDGTLLTSEKKMTEETIAAINKCFEADKHAVLCTGRSVSEIREYAKRIPKLRYAVCVSGAIVYDLVRERIIAAKAISEETAGAIISAAALEDTRMQFLAIDSIVQKDFANNTEKYYMEPYGALYRATSVLVESSSVFYKEKHPILGKINIYHTDTAARKRTEDRLSGQPLEMVYSEVTGLECTLKGVSKALGLKMLCEYLAIPLDKTVMVGDADNDVSAMEAAGFAIAMGNAPEHVKELCDKTTADCDHNGAAKAIDFCLSAID